MAKRTVDVFFADRRAYTFHLESLDQSATDNEFIELAKDAMRRNGYSEEALFDARFIVKPS